MRSPGARHESTLKRRVDRTYNELLRHLPDRPGNRVRRRWLRRHAGGVGHGAIVARESRVLGAAGLVLGAGVVVARGVCLDARGGLVLEDEALIGFESVLLTSTHAADRLDVAIQAQGMVDAPVRVGRRAWLGMRVLVLPGVTIGADAVVAAGAVVAADVAAGIVVGGVPARPISTRAALAARPGA